jgi:hypothetical protein
MAKLSVDQMKALLREYVGALGRDDIGVGDVSEAGGVISFTLTKGEHSHRGQMHADLLENRDRALQALTEIVMKISKPIEREHIHGTASGPG